jgi:hypothetical protein
LNVPERKSILNAAQMCTSERRVRERGGRGEEKRRMRRRRGSLF